MLEVSLLIPEPSGKAFEIPTGNFPFAERAPNMISAEICWAASEF